jgi:hypothetical protein
MNLLKPLLEGIPLTYPHCTIQPLSLCTVVPFFIFILNKQL